MRFLIHYSKVIFMCGFGLVLKTLGIALLMGICSVPLYLFETACNWMGYNPGLVAIVLTLVAYFIIYAKQHPLSEAEAHGQ